MPKDLPPLLVPPDTIVPTDDSTGAPAAGTFAVSSDGAATYFYPIWVPLGRRGIEPNLAITYNSQHENGLLGVGWSLKGLSAITRCKRDIARDGYNAAITFTQADAFALDGQRLVPFPGADTAVPEYRTEEDCFAKVISGPRDDLGPLWFEVRLKDGRIFFYGSTPDSRLEGQRYESKPASLDGKNIQQSLAQRVRLTWALSEVRDRFGNNLTVEYSVTGNPVHLQGYEQLPQAIRYTGTVDNSLSPQRVVNFEYEPRPDTSTTFVSGFRLQIRHRLLKIVLSAPNPSTVSAVRSYSLKYWEHSRNTGRSLLYSISECDANGVCLPPTIFGYTLTLPDFFLDYNTHIHDDTAVGESTPSEGPHLGQLYVGDLNGDGCDDLIYTVLDKDGKFIEASYRLSAGYDAIVSGAAPFPMPNPAIFPPIVFELTGTPNSGSPNSVPPATFDFNPLIHGHPFTYTELLALDLDLDGRSDLLYYSVYDRCSHPEFGCDTSTVWYQDFTTWVFLASNVPPSQWNPRHDGLFGEQTTVFSQTTTPKALFGSAPVDAYYHSIYVGDINGAGFPDIVHIKPDGWTYQLNHGRAAPGTLALEPESPLFPSWAPFYGTMNVFMVDIFRDGTTDLLLRDPNGHNWYAAFSLRYDTSTSHDVLSSPSLQRVPVNLALVGGEQFVPPRRDWFIDVNGDGLPNCVSIPIGGGNPWVSENTGNGFENPVQVTVGAPPPSDNIISFDYNGDGTQDLVYGEGAWSTGSGSATGLYALLSHDDYYDSGSMALIVDQNQNQITYGKELHAFDATGDGRMDLVQIVNGTIHVYIRQGPKPDLLDEIYDRTAHISVDYAPITSPTVYRTTVPPGVVSSGSDSSSSGSTYVVNRGLWVVRSYTIPRAGSLTYIDPINKYSFSYTDGRKSLLGHGWLGFASVTMTDMQTNAVTVTRYDNRTMVGSAYPYARRPNVRETYVTLSDNTLFRDKVVTTTYKTAGTPDGSYLVVSPKEVLEQEFEYSNPWGLPIPGFTPFRSIDTTMEYDEFDNPTTVVRKTGDGYIDTHTVKYSYDLASWLVAMPSWSFESSSTPTGQTMTRTKRFIADPMTGAVSEQIIEPNGDESTYNRTQYHLDVHGVLTGFTSSDASGQQQRSLSLQFDPSEDLYPTMVTNALNQTGRFATHPGLGVLAVHENANGVRKQWQYDGFGRLKQVLAPDGANSSLTYLGNSVVTHYANGQKVGVLYDPYLNEVEWDSTGFDGQTIVTLTSYNSQGLVAERDGPCFVSAPCSSSGSDWYSYDELGRLIGVLHADGSSRKRTHVGLKTTEFDELQNQHYVVQDQLGQVVKSVAITDAGREISTDFAYEPFGLLHTITDSNGNVVYTAHDGKGRLLESKDPDSGDHFYHWTSFDELHDEQDGNGFFTTYSRDALGRAQTVTDKDGITNFYWDTAPNGIGKIASTRSADRVTTTYGYDPQGRTDKVTWKINSGVYGFGFTYDPVGRIDTITYPSVPGLAAFAVQQKYNAFGFLKQVLDAKTQGLIWQTDAQSERGRITAEQFGNGLLTNRRFDVRGFLRGIETVGNGTTQQDFTYDYYPTGSLESRIDRLALSTVTEQFGYDSLDRLHEWSVSRQAKLPISSPAIELLDQTFDYNDIGNLKQRTTTFGSLPSLLFQYGQNAAGPHAVTQVNSDRYTYNRGGNQISGPKRIVRYKAFNLPERIRQGKAKFSFEYDAGRRRVSERSPNGDATIYVGGLYERRVHRGRTTQVFYVQGTERLVAQVQLGSTGKKSLFFHADHLGSVETVTDQAGATCEQIEYEPLGQPVDPYNPARVLLPGGCSVTQGFTGQVEDTELRLINMKGRIYDPKVGHFLTPDPLVQYPLFSESLNRYSYAWNNPLKWIDPSGFQEEGPEGDTPAPPPSSPEPETPTDPSGPFQMQVGPYTVTVTGTPDTGTPEETDSTTPTAADDSGAHLPAAPSNLPSLSNADFERFQRLLFYREGMLPPFPLSKSHIDITRTKVDMSSPEWRMPESLEAQLFGSPGTRYMPTVLSLLPRLNMLLLPELPAFGLTEAIGGEIVLYEEGGVVSSSRAAASEFVPKQLNPGINATTKGMEHTLERHTVNDIAKFAGKSKFATDVNLTGLIEQGTQMPMLRQANGNFARIFDAGRIIGVDRATGLETSLVTIITRANGDLVTMFPGVP